MSLTTLSRSRRFGAVSVVAALVAVLGASPAAAFGPAPPDLFGRWFVNADGRIVTTSSALTGGSLDGATAAQRTAAVNAVTRGTTVPATGGVVGQPGTGSFKVPASAAWQASKGGTAILGVTAFFAGFEGANMVMRAAGVDNVGLEALFPAEPDPNWYPHANGDVVVRSPGWVNGGPYQFTNIRNNVNVVNQAAVTIVEAPMHGETQPRILAETSALSWGGPSGSWAETLGLSYRLYGVNPDGSVQSVGIGGLFPPYRGTSTYPQAQTATVSLANLTRGLDRLELFAEPTPGYILDTWYPVGHPDRPADAEANPPRQWETRWGCTSGAGGARPSAQFREADATYPEFPEAGPCESGTLAHVEIWQTSPGHPEIEPTKVVEWDATGAGQWAAEYPQCTDGSCVLELYRLDPASGAKTSCFDNPAACVNWWQDPARADNYRCEYAGTVVDLTECRIYRPTFDVATGDDVETDSGARPASETNPYGDPATGDPQPLPQGAPVPGGEPGDSPDGGSLRCGNAPPFEFSVGGFGYWIVHGGLYVLCKAFVPQNLLQTAKVSTAVQSTALGELGATAGRLFSFLAYVPDGTCGVLATTTVAAFGGRSLTIDTCAEPWPSFRPVRQVIGWSFIIFAVVVGVMTCLNTIRVKPTSGKDA